MCWSNCAPIFVTPDVLIDMKKIDGVSDIARDGDGWRIGVAVTGAEMTEHNTLGKEWPGVVEAMDLVGSTQIQGPCHADRQPVQTDHPLRTVCQRWWPPVQRCRSQGRMAHRTGCWWKTFQQARVNAASALRR